MASRPPPRKASCGGLRYNPTTSAVLGPNSGSVRMHQLLRLSRHMLGRRRIRQTGSLLTSPVALPGDCRSIGNSPLGAVPPASTRCAMLSSYLAGWPGRAASLQPAIRCLPKRCRHFDTRAARVCSWSAICWLVFPSCASKMIRASLHPSMLLLAATAPICKGLHFIVVQANDRWCLAHVYACHQYAN